MAVKEAPLISAQGPLTGGRRGSPIVCRPEEMRKEAGGSICCQIRTPGQRLGHDLSLRAPASHQLPGAQKVPLAGRASPLNGGRRQAGLAIITQ